MQWLIPVKKAQLSKGRRNGNSLLLNDLFSLFLYISNEVVILYEQLQIKSVKLLLLLLGVWQDTDCRSERLPGKKVHRGQD